MKSLVAQTRSACANEVRKRDRQIDSLKKAIADAARVRGGGKSRDVITITVTGEYSALGDESAGMPAGATENDGYSLRMETNEFLTELARGLSEENEGLLALVRRTVEGLREMSGLDRDAESSSGHDHGSHDFVTRPPQKSAEELAAELEGIVEHLRSILTNPSFAPIEEVEVRDEAIHRLRAGLETMEARWKDAIHMIDGWRKRMVSSGKSVDMEDLQMGLRLSPVRVRDVAETANAMPIRLPCVQEEDKEEEQEEEEVDHRHNYNQDEDPAQKHLRPSRSAESLHLVSAPGYDDSDLGDDSDSDSSIFEDDIDINELDVEEPNVQILQISTAESVDSHALPEPSQIKPLKDSYSSGNRGPTNQPPYRKRHGDFTTIVEENTWDLAGMDEKESSVPPSHVSKPASPKQNQQKKASGPLAGSTRPGSTASYDSPLFGKSIERPAQTQSKRNLFSRPPSREQPSVTTTHHESERSPTARTTRSSTTKSGPPSPVVTTQSTEASKPTVSDPHPTSTDPQKADEAVQHTTSSGPSSDTKQARTRSPTRVQPAASSRLPRPNTQQQQQQQSPLNMATIAAKLAASEREADAARVRAKLRAVRRCRRISGKIDENAGPAPTSPTEMGNNMNNSRTTIKRIISNTEPETETRTGTEPETREPMEDMDPVKKYLKPVSASSSSSSRRLEEEDDVDELALSPDTIALKTTQPGEKNLTGTEAEAEAEAGTGMDMDMDMGIGIGVRVDKVRRKREKRTCKVASRRRSTLSPWELQGLITGNVGGVGSPAR